MPASTNASNNAAASTVFAALLLSGMLTGSADPKRGPVPEQLRQRPALVTIVQPHTLGDLNATEKNWIEQHCGPGGLPVRTATHFAEPVRIVAHQTYVLAHSSHLKIPFWVCERLKKSDLDGPNQGRLSPEPFAPNPKLKGWPRAEKNDYQKSGFGQLGLATGHMMPDADRTHDALKRETYYLSNMVPQVGGRFNSSKWLQLEKKVRAWSLSKPLYIITGGLLHEPEEAGEHYTGDRRAPDGLVAYYVVGENEVAVPTHIYKIIVAAPSTNTATWESLAILMENRPYLSKDDAEVANRGKEIDYTAFLKSIDDLEKLTGYDFFPELDDTIEAQFESSAATKLWD